MAKPAELEKLTGVASRFGAFIAERHPFALTDALDAWEAATRGRDPEGEAALEALRSELRRELRAWNLTGLGLMLCSGFLIFIGGEISYFNGDWFRIKMEILALALIFHFTLFRKLTKAPENHFPPLRNKLTAAVSLLLWFGVAVSGRSIAFFS